MTEHLMFIGIAQFLNNETDTFFNINYITKPLNQIGTAELTIYNMTSFQSGQVVKGAKVKIYDSTKYMFHGYVRKITNDIDGGNVIVYCEDPACLLADRINYNSSYTDGRKEWTETSANTIISELVSGIMSLNSVSADVTNTRIGFRAEYDTKLEAVSSIARICGCDWWCTFNGSDQPILNITRRGTSFSRQTFILGDGCATDEPATDLRSVYNKIYVLGYGDGINQIRSVAKHATTVRTVLTNNLSISSNVVYVKSTAGFSANSYIMIGMERCRITSVNSSNALIVARWQNADIKQYNHSVGIEVVLDTYTETSPQSGSSIQINGLIENRWVDASIIEQNAVDFLAQRLLTKYRFSSTTGTITYLDMHCDADVGDIITIRGYNNVDVQYRCVSFEYDGESGCIELTYSTPGSEEVTTLELQRTMDLNNPYGQGATNVFQVMCYENCQDGYPLNMRFFLPDDVVAINKVLLSFKITPYRTYHRERAGHQHQTVLGINSRETANRGTQNVYMMGHYHLIDHAAFISGNPSNSFTEGNTSSAVQAATYGIDTYVDPSPNVFLSVGIDGSEQIIGSYTTGANNIELKSFITKPGNWYNIQFSPLAGKRLRIEANAYIKVFIKSN